MDIDIINAHRFIMFLHITLGFVNLASFWIAIALIKKPLHKTAGKIFFYSMVANSIVSILTALNAIFNASILYPEKPIIDTLRFNIILLYMAMIPAVSSLTAFAIIEKNKFMNKPRRYDCYYLFFVTSAVLILFAAAKLNSLETAASGMVPCVYIVAVYLSMRSRMGLLAERLNLKKMYHARFFVFAGTALHAAFFSGGAAVRYFGIPYFQIFQGFRFYFPMIIGIVADIVLYLYYKEKNQTETKGT